MPQVNTFLVAMSSFSDENLRSEDEQSKIFSLACFFYIGANKIITLIIVVAPH